MNRNNSPKTMSTIYYNSDVAQVCGKNGIIKAVLLNYIYNYHKRNIRKGAGHPASISLKEFVYRYTLAEKSVWKRSFIHRVIKDMVTDGFLTKTMDNNMPVYAVSNQIVSLLNADDAKTVSFSLEAACDHGLHNAIVAHYVLHVIEHSPKGEAYNLSVDDMAEVNRISPAQIYRCINYLVANRVVKKIKSPLKFRSRSLSLAKY